MTRWLLPRHRFATWRLLRSHRPFIAISSVPSSSSVSSLLSLRSSTWYSLSFMGWIARISIGFSAPPYFCQFSIRPSTSSFSLWPTRALGLPRGGTCGTRLGLLSTIPVVSVVLFAMEIAVALCFKPIARMMLLQLMKLPKKHLFYRCDTSMILDSFL